MNTQQNYGISIFYRCHIMIQTCLDFATWLRQRAEIESQSIHAYLASCIWYPCPSECQLPMLTLIKYSLIWHIFDSWRGVSKTFAIYIISHHSPPPRIRSHCWCTICISSNPLPCTFYAQFSFSLSQTTHHSAALQISTLTNSEYGIGSNSISLTSQPAHHQTPLHYGLRVVIEGF